MYIDPELIIQTVEAYFGNRFHIVSNCKRKTTIRARWIAIRLVRELSQLSNPEMEEEFDTDISQINRACKHIKDNMGDYAQDLTYLKLRIRKAHLAQVA